jgi:phage FluMu gp28-like protein
MRENDKRLVLRNLGGGESEVRGKSADNPVSLLGEGLDWLIVDEAARLKPTIWEGHLSQRLLDKKGWALLISTPRGKGWFFDAWRRGQNGKDPDFESWNYPSRSNPHLDEAMIEAERARLPERVFKQEYEAEFLEGAGQVFRYIRESATGEWARPQPGRRYAAGLDLGKVDDYTVLVILDEREKRVVYVDRFHRIDWAQQIQRVHHVVRNYNNAQLTVDSTGAGEPVFEAIQRAGCYAQAYTFTQKSKAALIDNLALLLVLRQLILPRPELWPDGVDELESYQFSVSDQGNVRMNAPSGQHDDCVIALALAAWEIRPGAYMRFSRTVGMY